MTKFRYYGLALAETEPPLFLPEPLRGRDFAVVQPSSCVFPRLFKSPGVAHIAGAAWEKGNPGKKLEIVPMKLEPEQP